MRFHQLKMFMPATDAAGAIVEAVEETITKSETPPKKEDKKPELNEEGEFFIRRVAEEVAKNIASIFAPKDAETETETEIEKPREKRAYNRHPKTIVDYLPNLFK